MSGVSRSFRIVCRAGGEAVVEALLAAQGYVFAVEPFHSLARRLEIEPIPLGNSLAARLGLVYIQDRSSMLPPALLAPPPGTAVLDMCAAPGSKTGFLAQLVGPDGLAFGCEPNEGRLGILRNNLRRLCLPQTATALAKSEKLPFANGSFDHILLDPPCSGWGTEDKHPGISGLWTGEKTKPLIRLQRKLLHRAADLLAPGGRLMYSTCTTNPQEDEEQAVWAAAELGLVPVPLDPPPGFVFAPPALAEAQGTLKVADDSAGQGFFLAAFAKPPQETVPDPMPSLRLPGTKLDPCALDVPDGLDWGALPPGEVWDFGGRVYFLHQLALKLAVPALRWQGLPLGRMADGAFQPDGLCRALLGTAAGPGGVDVDEPEQLLHLLDGRGLDDPGGTGMAPLFFRGVPLAWLRRKSGRLLWAEK